MARLKKSNLNTIGQPMIGDPSPVISNPSVTDQVVNGSFDSNGNFVPEGFNPKNNRNAEIDVKQLILDSSVYKQAHDLFSSDLKYGQAYLVQLQMIPDSVMNADYTFFDRIGISSKHDDAQREQYNLAVAEIIKLVNSYYEFINSLPVTQVQQASDAGYNMAISGQGLNSSQKQFSDPQTGNIKQSSFDGLNAVTGIGNLLLSVIPTVMNPLSTLMLGLKNFGVSSRQVDISALSQKLAERKQDFDEKSYVADIWNELISSGVDTSSVTGQVFFGDDFDFTLPSLYKVLNYLDSDPKFRYLQNNEKIKQFFSDIEVASVPIGADPYNVYARGALKNYFGQDVGRLLQDTGNSLLNSWKYTLKYKGDLAKYQSEYQSGLSASDASKMTNAQNNMLTTKANFEKMQYEQKMKFYNEQIKRCEESYDPVSKFILSQMLFNDPWLSSVFGFNELNNGINSQSGSSLLNPLNGGLLGFGFNVLPDLLGSK